MHSVPPAQVWCNNKKKGGGTRGCRKLIPLQTLPVVLTCGASFPQDSLKTPLGIFLPYGLPGIPPPQNAPKTLPGIFPPCGLPGTPPPQDDLRNPPRILVPCRLPGSSPVPATCSKDYPQILHSLRSFGPPGKTRTNTRTSFFNYKTNEKCKLVPLVRLVRVIRVGCPGRLEIIAHRKSCICHAEYNITNLAGIL